MKIIFFGSSGFAVPVLEALCRAEEVILAVTQPDRKKGRTLKLSPTPVKLNADRLKIKVFQPETINSADSIKYLEGLKADLFVVVSFGQILSRAVLGLPKLYSINVHASLLPKYRGAAPINRAIADGEKETGVSIIKMNEKMDEGDIVLKEPLTIGDSDDAVTISEKLSIKGAGLLMDAIKLIKENKAGFTAQDNANATYAAKLKKEEGLIDWAMPAAEIYNRVRAFVPWPGCYTYWDSRIIKIWKAVLAEDFPSKNSKPGEILKVDKNGILAAAKKGCLAIEELQMEGKRRMSAEEFIIGHKKMRPGVIFSLHR